MSPPPRPAAEALPSDLGAELADAIRLRRDYGLRSDLEYVRAVVKDPRASTDAYGVPVYPEEFDDVQSRFQESRNVVAIVQRYAADHVDEFGGLYIDESSHAGVVSLWTRHLAEHASAIKTAVGPDARVAFVDDVDGLMARGIELGGIEALPATDWPGIGRGGYLPDPDGNVFGPISPVMSDGRVARGVGAEA